MTDEAAELAGARGAPDEGVPQRDATPGDVGDAGYEPANDAADDARHEGAGDAASDAGEDAGGEAAGDAASSSGLPGDDLTEAQLEALLFVAERPLGRRELATITGASSETVDARLGDLEVTLAARGIRLLVDGDRVALATAPEAGLLIGRYVGREPTRLSPATLETLAIVAYRQPVTKAGIERIRGVDAEYAIRSLLHRRLVVELGRADAPGRPILYGTSTDFLERFGLLSLDELPVLDASVAERLVGADEPRGAGERDRAAGAGDLASGSASRSGGVDDEDEPLTGSRPR